MGQAYIMYNSILTAKNVLYHLRGKILIGSNEYPIDFFNDGKKK
jgi:hypothetical protein